MKIFCSTHIIWPVLTCQKYKSICPNNDVQKSKALTTGINCSCVIHSWSLISQFHSLEVDNNFACDGSFASSRDYGWLSLYKINTVVKPIQVKESEVFEKHRRFSEACKAHHYCVCFILFYCTGCYNHQYVYSNKFQIFHLLVEAGICQFLPMWKCYLFFYINRHSKQYFRDFFRRYISINRVDVNHR